MGRGAAIAFDVVVASVGDCRRDIGRDIRPTDVSCRVWMAGEVAEVCDCAVAMTSVDTEGAGVEEFPRKKPNGVTIALRAEHQTQY